MNEEERKLVKEFDNWLEIRREEMKEVSDNPKSTGHAFDYANGGLHAITEARHQFTELFKEFIPIASIEDRLRQAIQSLRDEVLSHEYKMKARATEVTFKETDVTYLRLEAYRAKLVDTIHKMERDFPEVR